MSIIGKLFGIAIDVATIPVAVAKDIITLGGAATDESPATPQALEDLFDDLTDL